MFDIGWMELMVIGVVALIVVGPEDLPQMFRQIGRFTAKLRQMAREFSRAMEQAANESGVNEVRKDLAGLTKPVTSGMSSLKSAADRFEKWDPVKGATRPATPAPTPTPSPAPAPSAAAASAPAPTPASSAPDPSPAAAPTTVRTLGPETAALAAKTAERRAARSKTTAAKAAPPAPEGDTTLPAASAAPAARKRGGRTRAAAKDAPKDSA